MTNEENKSLNEVISDFQREMFDKGRFYQSEMAQYLMQLSFERCSQWKDEQFAAEKQALIDKACSWLENIIFDKVDALFYDDDDIEFVKTISGKDFADIFRKAMEE